MDDFPEFYDSEPPSKVWNEEIFAGGLNVKVCLSRIGTVASNLLGCTLHCDVPPNTRYNIAWLAIYTQVTGYPDEIVNVSFVQPASDRTQCAFNYGEGVVSD